MDLLIIILGLLIMLLGIVGSFLPILPGPLTSWAGLLVLSFADSVEVSSNILILTFLIALAIFILDYIIPAMGTKKYGGSKLGMIGTIIGLIFGIFSPIPFGIIIGPFIGALIGELLYQNDTRHALRAAYGSLVGFLASTVLKFSTSVVYLVLFLWMVF